MTGHLFYFMPLLNEMLLILFSTHNLKSKEYISAHFHFTSHSLGKKKEKSSEKENKKEKIQKQLTYLSTAKKENHMVQWLETNSKARGSLF